MAEANPKFRLKTGDDIRAWTTSTKKVIGVLVMLGLLLTAVMCVCGQEMIIHQKTESRHPKDKGYCYFCTDCGKDRSLRRNTVFYGSDKHLRNFIDLMLAFVKGDSVSESSAYANYQRGQGGKIFKKFRQYCGRYLEDHFAKLGDDFIVEIDEAAFNKKNKHHRGRTSNTRWVFGIIERKTGYCKFVHVPNRERETLLPIIQKYIEDGAKVNSDMFRSYWCLGEAGYVHRMVTHSHNFVDTRSGTHTNTIEGYWKHAKAGV